MEFEWIVVSKTGMGGRIVNWQPLQYTTPELDKIGKYPKNFQPKELIPEGAQKVKLPNAEGARFIKYNGKKHRIEENTIIFDESLPDYHGVLELENTLLELRQEMAANDYKQMKYYRGALPEEEWESLKAWYAEKIALVNALEAEMAIVQEEEA